MKIALVMPYDLAYPGGVKSHVTHLAQHFAALGHDVTIYGPTSKPKELENNMVGVGNPQPISAGGSTARLVLGPQFMKVVRQILREENFDVVHVHEPYVSFMTIAWIRASDCTLVSTFHAARENGATLYQYMKRSFRRFLKRTHGLIAVSEAAKEFISSYYPEFSYDIIPNGVEVKRFALPHEPWPELQDDKINILFVGRIDEERKGLETLLQAYQEVKRQRSNTRLVVVGGGNNPDKVSWYRNWVEEECLRDLIFTDFVSDQDLVRYYQSAHIFCAPNTGNESQGIVLLEAMAASLPVIASNISGFAGVITNGYDGLLVTPNDHLALADRIIKLVDNPAERNRLATKGYSRSQYYSWDKIAQQILSYYERMQEVRLKKIEEKPKKRRYFHWPSR